MQIEGWLAVFRAAGRRADYFGFGCERTRGSLIHACNTTMQYAFVLHCCDVMALCTASQISNKKQEV